MNKRNFVKLGCAFMAVSMLGSLSGCASKATPANFRKLEDKLGATIYEVDAKDDLEDIFKDADMEDELEDGLILILSDDAIADLYDEAMEDMDEEALDIYDLYYGDSFNAEEDIVSVQMFVQGVYDHDEINMLYSIMVEYKDKQTADFLFDDFTDNLDGFGWLFKFIGRGFDLDDFNKAEFSNGNGSGHMIYNYSYDALCDTLDRNEDALDIMNIDIDDITDELEDTLEDIQLSVGIYQSGATITSVIAVSNDGDEVANLGTLCSTLGLKNPTTVTNSETMNDLTFSFVVPMATSMGRYMSAARRAAEEVAEHNGEVAMETDSEYYEEY